jgi:hypothetical protein
MSAANFQIVLAQLIRFPDESLEGIEQRLEQLELSSRERRQLDRMAGDPLVRKFGYKMQFCRQRDATEVMRLSKAFIDQKTLDTMYQQYFEPTRVTSDLAMLGVQFLEFALTDARCRDLVAEREPFLKDLMIYDHARAFIVRQVMNLEGELLSSVSRLSHTAFIIKDFLYDVPTIDRLKVSDPSSRVAPQQKPMKLIFLRCEQPPYFRIFQIDELIERFLELQRRAPEKWEGPLPPAYPSMVSVGLCRKMQ